MTTQEVMFLMPYIKSIEIGKENNIKISIDIDYIQVESYINLFKNNKKAKLLYYNLSINNFIKEEYNIILCINIIDKDLFILLNKFHTLYKQRLRDSSNLYPLGITSKGNSGEYI